MGIKASNHYDFNQIACSYTKNLNHLCFIRRIDLKTKIQYSIPIRHYHFDDYCPTVLWCHDSKIDIGQIQVDILASKLNANIITFDYAGYGMHSKKLSSENDCYKDVEAVYYQYILPIVRNPKDIAIIGDTFGSIMAIYLAYILRFDSIKPKNLILLSPIYSFNTLFTWLPLPFDSFKNYKFAPEIKCATTIYHGKYDKFIPLSCVKELSLQFSNLAHFYILEEYGHDVLNNPLVLPSMEYLINY